MKVIKTLFVLAFLAAIAYAGYIFFLPKVISEAITSEEIPDYVPETTRKQVEEIREVVQKEVKKLPEKMEKMDLSYEDIVQAVDEMEEENIMDTYNALRESPPATTDEAYDIIVSNLDLKTLDMESLRPYFNENVRVEDIHRAVQKAEKSKVFSKMSLPVLKNTLQQILIQRESEIKNKLEE